MANSFVVYRECSNCSKSYWYLLIPPLFEIIVLYALPFLPLEFVHFKSFMILKAEFLVVRICVFLFDRFRTVILILLHIVKPLFIGVFWFSF